MIRTIRNVQRTQLQQGVQRIITPLTRQQIRPINRVQLAPQTNTVIPRTAMPMSGNRLTVIRPNHQTLTNVIRPANMNSPVRTIKVVSGPPGAQTVKVSPQQVKVIPVVSTANQGIVQRTQIADSPAGRQAVRIVRLQGPNQTPNKTYSLAKVQSGSISQVSGKVSFATGGSRVTISAPNQGIRTQGIVSSSAVASVGGLQHRVQVTNSPQLKVVQSRPHVVHQPQMSPIISAMNHTKSPSYLVRNPGSAVVQPRQVTPHQILTVSGINKQRSSSPGMVSMNPSAASSPTRHLRNIISQSLAMNSSPSATPTHSPSIHGPRSNSRPNSRPGTPTNGMFKSTQLTDKDVSRLWQNGNVKLKQINRSSSVSIYIYILNFFY